MPLRVLSNPLSMLVNSLFLPCGASVNTSRSPLISLLINLELLPTPLETKQSNPASILIGEECDYIALIGQRVRYKVGREGQRNWESG